MDRGHRGNLARMPDLKEILGFLMTTESQDFGLTCHTRDGAL